MTDETKSEKIKKFNEDAQKQQQAKAAQAQNLPPAQVNVIPMATMSAADIALIQKAQAGQQLTQEEQIRLKALETKQNLQAAESAKKKAAEEERKNAAFQKKAILETGAAVSQLATPLEPAVNWFANVPTPGGLATILIILVVFVLAIVPVDASGTTRLKLVWLTLTGKTHLKYEEDKAFGGGGSGDFGSQSASPTTPGQLPSMPAVLPPITQPILPPVVPPVITPTFSSLDLPGFNMFDIFGGMQ